MIREIQEQQRKEENEVANYMIKDIQAQQKLARHLMRQAETRTRVKPPPSRRQLTKKKHAIGQVFRGYNGLLGEHLVQKQNNSKTSRPKKIGSVFRGYNAMLSNFLDKKKNRSEVRRRIQDIQFRRNTKKKKTYTV